jgi:hypothetical protein
MRVFGPLTGSSIFSTLVTLVRHGVGVDVAAWRLGGN